MVRNTVITLAFFFVFFNRCLLSQETNEIVTDTVNPGIKKIPGFIGLYHNSTGTIYGGWGWTDGELIQSAFNFGENAIISQATYYGYTFENNLDSNCTSWDINKIYGMLRPPSESGQVNQPADTSLLLPFASLPGMIQGAHRYSELSKQYPRIQGLIIDDFFQNYTGNKITINDLQNIKDALLGKTVDNNGNVDHNSKATTPNLKLYIVLYARQLNINDQNVNNLIDGVNFWMSYQNEDYKQFDNYINTIKQIYPGKKIIAGVYINNSHELMTPQGIHYVIQRSIDLYDNGSINGVLIFSAPWLTQQYITRARWDSLAIPPLLDSVYYPYLGEAAGKVIDAKSGQPIQHALVTIQRLYSENPIIVSKKFTQNTGEYNFGAWAGKDSSIAYEIRVEDSTYESKTIDVELLPGKKITLPEIQLQSVTDVLNEKDNLPLTYELKQNYPDPFNPSTVISYSIQKEDNVTLKVFNFLGQEVSSLVNKIQTAGSYKIIFNARSISSGVYFYSLRSGNFIQVKKMVLLK
ncbi:MAG: T9SS type A sorting domain-containing protein [Bacteroidetes bacterium]|nr:T9SS type A sorting domain-containing protein [Bacteroidota bacterium]